MMLLTVRSVEYAKTILTVIKNYTREIEMDLGVNPYSPEVYLKAKSES